LSWAMADDAVKARVAQATAFRNCRFCMEVSWLKMGLKNQACRISWTPGMSVP
jgi:hypothetical protein